MAGEPRPGTEQFRAIKSALNQEGWEGDEDTGAAVFLGTQEEAEQARARMEQEGNAIDVRSYIKLNASTLATKEEIESVSETWQDIKVGTGDISFNSLNSLILRYKGKEGDLKELIIRLDGIATLKDRLDSCKKKLGDDVIYDFDKISNQSGYIIKPFQELGFTIDGFNANNQARGEVSLAKRALIEARQNKLFDEQKNVDFNF